jgi:hypothetical protein
MYHAFIGHSAGPYKRREKVEVIVRFAGHFLPDIEQGIQECRPPIHQLES